MKTKLSSVMKLHMLRLVYRSLLFIAAVVYYIIHRVSGGLSITASLKEMPVIVIVLWLVFAFEMLLRFFPSKAESHGCQKQFKKNYQKTGKTEIKIEDNNATFIVAIIWIILNCIFGWLHMGKMISDDIMILLCLAFSVCDIICILFFCPFQTWFFKNRCCNTCRIYNWDYAMMFTPLFFVQGLYSKSLLVLSVLLLARWELSFYKHPERFAVSTNEYLKCEYCEEKLCKHKKQLILLWDDVNKFTKERIEKLEKTEKDILMDIKQRQHK